MFLLKFVGWANCLFVCPRWGTRGHKNVPTLRYYQLTYLNFNVASPINTNSIVIIQKRTTTCVSFQPFNS